MKRIVIGLFFLLISVLAYTENSTKDFRNCTWGMSKKEVMKAEGIVEKDIVFQDSTLIAISSTIATYPCYIVYIYSSDKLVRTKYSFNVEHSNNNLYYTIDYPAIKELLSKKYGSPIKDNRYWSRDLYKDDSDSYGMAIAVGDLSLYTNWENESTELILYLTGDNYVITFGVEYTSKNLRNLEAEKTEKEAVENL